MSEQQRADLPFRDLVDLAPDGVIACDQTGTILLVNVAAERMFGYSRAELIGQPIAIESPLAAEGSRHLIVYIEDNPSNIALMHAVIEDLPRLEMLTASTAEVGLELIRTRRPAVVIMDINLPGMSGIEATRRLAEWPETRSIPVIALSAAVLPKDTARAKESGFYRYLTKPVKIDELTTTLEAILLQKS